MTGEESAGLDAVFHALADSTRRTILEELAKRDEQSLFEICVRLVEWHGVSIKRQSVSKHLTVLRQVGLVDAEKRGKQVFYSLQLKCTAHFLRCVDAALQERGS